MSGLKFGACWRTLLRLWRAEGDARVSCPAQLGFNFEWSEKNLRWETHQCQGEEQKPFPVSGVRGPRLPVLHLRDFT